jgi:hypothetical protein
MKEFDWLEGCTSCNKDCCHNEDKFIQKDECNRYKTVHIPEYLQKMHEQYDTSDKRPLECRLFPFDVKDIDGKMTWVMWNNCHVNPKLDYQKFINFFERKFSREVSLDNIKQYVEHRKSEERAKPEKPLREGYIVIREVNWPIDM